MTKLSLPHIIQGLLTDRDILLIEKESHNRRQAIYEGVPHTYISTAEVEALSPNTLDSLVNPARRKRDNSTPTFATHLGEAFFAVGMGNGSRGGKVKVLPSVGRKLPSVEVASTPSVPKMERGGGSRLAIRERVNRNIQETRKGNQSSQFGTHAQRERRLATRVITRPMAINAGETAPIILTRPVVQSRINLQNGNNKVGWQHVLNRHFSGGTASQFSISPDELRLLLQDKSVVSVPITKTRASIRRTDVATQTIYERVVQVNKNIGFDKFNNNKATNIMTIQTDKYGNLITVTPGRIQ